MQHPLSLGVRALHLVVIVDPGVDEVIYDEYVFACDEESAKRKAVRDCGSRLVGDLDDYDILAVPLGWVRSKPRG